MYEHNQKMLCRVYACFCLVLVCFALFVGCSCRNTAGVQSGTDREVGAIKEQQRQAGIEIGRATDEVAAAEDALGRASERAGTVQAGLSECEAILKECQEFAGRNTELISELRKEN